MAMNDHDDDTRAPLSPDSLPHIHTTIDGQLLTVTKSAQWAAGENMRLKPEIRAKVVAAIGEAEAQRRYPNAFLTDEEVARMSEEPTK